MNPRLSSPLPRKLATLLLAATLLPACKSSSSRRASSLPRNLPRISVESPAASPRHSMSRGEYPFDERGNYITAWAAQGSRGGSSTSTTDYASWLDSHEEPQSSPEPEKTDRRSRFRSSREPASSSTPYIVSSATPAPPPPTSSQPAESPPVTLRSTATSSSTTRSQAASRSSSGSSTTAASSPKPKPTPKPAAKSTSSSSVTHTVKSGDTLYGLALRYKSSVAKIKSANGLKSDLIRPGMKLKIPRK